MGQPEPIVKASSLQLLQRFGSLLIIKGTIMQKDFINVLNQLEEIKRQPDSFRKRNSIRVLEATIENVCALAGHISKDLKRRRVSNG